MSLVIFFGFAFFIFALGMIAIITTFYRWHQESKLKKTES